MMSVRSAAHADRRFLIYILIWIVFGLTMLISASSPAAYGKFNDAYFFVKRQLMLGLLPGLVLLWLIARVDYRYWKKFSLLIYGLVLLLLLLVFIPGIGAVINGSRSWLQFGNYVFQPSELAKLGLIIFSAHLLSGKQRQLVDWQNGLLPVLIMLAPVPVLILLQPDIGTLSIIAVILLSMLYAAQVPKRYLLVLGGLCLILLAVSVYVAPYRLQRLTVFLHPELDPRGIGYHINQAFLAIGSGGFWGLGLGHSRQKFQYLPEVSSDSIYAVVAEELGFIFAAGLVLLILAVGWRGLRIARDAPDDFGRLLVVGIITWIVGQSFLNIGAMVGVLPLTGVPLPFVSHGGSALLSLLAAAGLVASVSRASR